MLLEWWFGEEEIPPGIKARSIADFLIDERTYKGDFELQARWDSSVIELERLSLLGIAAYGFLITTMSSDKTPNAVFLTNFHHFRYLPPMGVLCFALSAVVALFCNVLSCKCMKWQVDILRGFSRLRSKRWDDLDKEEIRKRVNYFQDKQRQQMRLNKLLLRVSTGSLCLGAIVTALSFALVLGTTPSPCFSPPHTETPPPTSPQTRSQSPS